MRFNMADKKKPSKEELDFWKNYNWDEPDTPKIKSQAQVNVARGNKLKALDPAFIKKHQAGIDKFFSSDASKERNEKISKSHQERLQDPEYRQFLKDNAQRLKNDPEWLQKCKDAQNNRTDEHKKNHREALYKMMQTEQWKQAQLDNGKRCWRAVVTPYGEYESLTAFEQETGWGFANKIKQMPHLYYYKDTGPGEIKFENVYYTPYCVYYNSVNAWELAKQNNDTYALKIKRSSDAYRWFNKHAKETPDLYYKRKEPKREWSLEIKKPSK